MADNVQTLTARLAADPTSLAFLPLGEHLRRVGQLDAALAVATSGLARYPHLADAHDLLGRIRSDQGDGDAAFDAWTTALRLQPDHAGAHKGLAYLAFRNEDLSRALRHLEMAAHLEPEDPSLAQAVERTRAQVAGRSTPTGGAPLEPPLDDTMPGTILVDLDGRRLAGSLHTPDGSEVSDGLAALLAGVSQEASRVARLLDLGSWECLSTEGPDAAMHLLPPTPDTLLLAVGEAGAPPGRLPLVARRAARHAQQWLERLG